jgi:hydrogenase maturation protease
MTVIFACGNPSRGDDALAPTLISQLPDIPNIIIIEDFQLQIEHALDLNKVQQAIFIDAAISGETPFSFYPIQPSLQVSYTSHALSPEEVLGVYQKTFQIPPPPSFVLAIRGFSFELGDPLSKTAQLNLQYALKYLCQVLSETTVDNPITAYRAMSHNDHDWVDESNKYGDDVES